MKLDMAWCDSDVTLDWTLGAAAADWMYGGRRLEVTQFTHRPRTWPHQAEYGQQHLYCVGSRDMRGEVGRRDLGIAVVMPVRGCCPDIPAFTHTPMKEVVFILAAFSPSIAHGAESRSHQPSPAPNIPQLMTCRDSRLKLPQSR
jgi:hypothetical protein